MAQAKLPAPRTGSNGEVFTYSIDEKSRTLKVSCREPVLDDDTGKPTGKYSQLETKVPIPKGADAAQVEQLARRADDTVARLRPSGLSGFGQQRLNPEQVLDQLEKGLDFGAKVQGANQSTHAAARSVERTLADHGITGMSLTPAVPMEKQIAAAVKVATEINGAANPDQALVGKATDASRARGESLIPAGRDAEGATDTFSALLKKADASGSTSPNAIVGDLNGKPVTRAEVEKMAKERALTQAEAIKVSIPGFADNGAPRSIELQVEPKPGGGYTWAFEGAPDGPHSSKRPLHTGDFSADGMRKLYESLESQKRYAPRIGEDWKPTKSLPAQTVGRAAAASTAKIAADDAQRAATLEHARVAEQASVAEVAESDKGKSFRELLDGKSAGAAGSGLPAGGLPHKASAPEVDVPGKKLLGKLGALGGLAAAGIGTANAAVDGKPAGEILKTAATEGARNFVPGADSALTASEGRAAEATLRGLEEVPVAGLLATEVLRPIGQALGLDVDPGLLQDAVASGAADMKATGARRQAMAQLAKDVGAVPENRRIDEVRVVRVDPKDAASGNVHFLLDENGRLHARRPAGEAISDKRLESGQGTLVIGVMRPDRRGGPASEAVADSQRQEAGLFLGSLLAAHGLGGMGTVRWERFSEREQAALAPRL